MPLPLPDSPRLRRRLAWSGALLLLAAGIVSVVVLIPSHAAQRAPVDAARTAQTLSVPRTVPPPRRALNALLDAFVPEVLGRDDLTAGRSLVTADARSSRADWLRGNMQFQAYEARGTHFHGWTVNYSYPGDIGFDIFIPAKRADAISMAFRGEAKQVAGRWQIAVFYAQATFQPAGKTQTVVADTDFQPKAIGASDQSGKPSAAWLALSAGLVAAITLAAIVVASLRWRRTRARMRAFERELARLR